MRLFNGLSSLFYGESIDHDPVVTPVQAVKQNPIYLTPGLVRLKHRYLYALDCPLINFANYLKITISSVGLQLLLLLTLKQVPISRILQIVFILIAFVPRAYPQGQVRFYTSVSEGPLVAGQPFQVQYIAEGATEVRDLVIPSFKGFSVHEVFDSRSTSVQSPNFQVVETVAKIIVLSSQKTGNFVIPGASALVDGKKLRSQNLRIKIVKASSALRMTEYPEEVPVEQSSTLNPGEDVEAKIRQNHFLKAVSSRSSCYVGEELMLTYKMYSRLNANSQVQKRPSLTGFSIVEMADSYDSRPDIEKEGGLSYYVNLVRKVHAFPLQPGKIKLDAAEISSTIHFTRNSALSAGSSFYDHQATIFSNPLEIDVKPLPGNQPENFSGAVGRFTMMLEVMQKEIHPGDLVKIKITIRGNGNIPLLVPPDIRWPKGVDTAEPAVKEEFNKYLYPLTGYKSFEYSFAAPDTGDYIIPATAFSYFNPESKKYEEAKFDSVNLRVTPDLQKKEVIKPNESLRSANEPKQFYWFGIVAAVIVGWISFQLFQSRKSGKENAKPLAEPVLVEEKKDPLEKARFELSSGNILSFYRETEQAIWKEIASSCHVLPSSLNKQNISSVLAVKGIDNGVITELMQVLRECEWALYAPDHETSDAADLLVRVESLLGKIC